MKTVAICGGREDKPWRKLSVRLRHWLSRVSAHLRCDSGGGGSVMVKWPQSTANCPPKLAPAQPCIITVMNDLNRLQRGRSSPNFGSVSYCYRSLVWRGVAWRSHRIVCV
jgi:hypothetical protein